MAEGEDGKRVECNILFIKSTSVFQFYLVIDTRINDALTRRYTLLGTPLSLLVDFVILCAMLWPMVMECVVDLMDDVTMDALDSA